MSRLIPCSNIIDDTRLIRSLEINYRHFEDDLNPRVFKKEGFKHLDRVVNLVRLGYLGELDHELTKAQCAKYRIYSIIDLHAAPGGLSVFTRVYML